MLKLQAVLQFVLTLPWLGRSKQGLQIVRMRRCHSEEVLEVLGKEKDLLALLQWELTVLRSRKVLNARTTVCRVAILDGSIVGVLIGGASCVRAHIDHFTVLPELRGQGIGKALLADAENVFRKLGVLRIILTVTADNRGEQCAEGLYRHHGYDDEKGELTMQKDL